MSAQGSQNDGSTNDSDLDLEALLERIEALELKASYSEDLLETLNLAVYRQQQTIDALVQELRQLRQQMPEAGQAGQRNLRDELPPHY